MFDLPSLEGVKEVVILSRSWTAPLDRCTCTAVVCGQAKTPHPPIALTVAFDGSRPGNETYLTL